MATCPAPWPVFHSTPLPNILFLLASQYPDMTYAEWPRNLYNISEGYRKFTYSDLANAVNASAWWIEENVGKLEDGKKDGKETLVYFGPNDIRYAVLFFASIIAGYKVSRLPFQRLLKGKRRRKEMSPLWLALTAVDRCFTPLHDMAPKR